MKLVGPRCRRLHKLHQRFRYFLCYLFLELRCQHPRRRGTVAAARGERGDGKIAGPSRKSCFSAGQLFDRIAVKKSSAILLFDSVVSVLLHFFDFLLIFQ